MERGGYVYILTNINNTTLYIGVTSDLITRIYEHQNKTYSSSFSARYNLIKLVYWESFHSIEEAIARENNLKADRELRRKLLLMNLTLIGSTCTIR